MKTAPSNSRNNSVVSASSGQSDNPTQSFLASLWRPVDIAWLIFFRVAFGGIMLWEVLRYVIGGRIRRFYIEPTVFFSYFGFDWVKPWPGDGMYFHFVVLGVLAICIALGFFYRTATALFAVAFTYVFLLDQSLYLNHLYLVCLISFLMVFLPANRAASLDARWEIVRGRTITPSWTLWLLRTQIGLVYFFGGIAKLNGDWLRGEPIRDWLAAKNTLPIVGPWLVHDVAAWSFAYGGLCFDLLIVPALLWKRTRIWAYAVAVLFHLTNAAVFNIGIFPWFMIAATTVFFDPGWPRRWFGSFGARMFPNTTSKKNFGSDEKPTRYRRVVIASLCVYLLIQVTLPLRHFLYRGDASWTEEGHRFSWRMKLRAKAADAQFFVTDTASGQTRSVVPDAFLKPHQVDEMLARPDMLLQFAHFLAAQARTNGAQNVEVRAVVRASLNGRAPQLLLDPSVNLAAIPRTLRSANWIRPLGEPLRREK
jgi:vitamin K-dependent gamma-carboxylase